MKSRKRSMAESESDTNVVTPGIADHQEAPSSGHPIKIDLANIPPTVRRLCGMHTVGGYRATRPPTHAVPA